MKAPAPCLRSNYACRCTLSGQASITRRPGVSHEKARFRDYRYRSCRHHDDPRPCQRGFRQYQYRPEQQRYVSERCLDHPNWRGCDDWRRNHNRWGSNEYRNWYRWNQPNLGGVAAGIFGFAVGAAIVGSMNRNVDRYDGFDGHVAACEARYRSYNAETDMFLGYDGRYHRCNL